MKYFQTASLPSNLFSYFSGGDDPNGDAIPDITGWDTSSVTNMGSMFYGASAFNQDIGDWDTSSVEGMDYMFYGASAFNQDIGDWDTSSVTNMGFMFYEAATFNQNIGGWDTSSVWDMSFMFEGASKFDQNIASWNTSSVTNMSFMFYEAADFSQNIDSWDTSSVTNMSFMFMHADAFDHDIGGWDISSVMNLSRMFDHSGMSTANFDATLIGWAAQNVQNNIELGAAGLTYSSASAAAREELINNHGWTISEASFVNTAPTGSVTLSGIARQGETLVADASSLGDLDGLGSLSYQWLRDGVAIDGATAGEYTVVQDDVASALSVTVSYTDGYGTGEAVTSAATPPVAIKEAFDFTLEVGGTPSGAFGNKYDNQTDADGKITGVFSVEDASKDLELSLTTYDVDFDDELQVFLNGTSLGYLGTTANNGLGNDTVLLSSAALIAGENQLTIQNKVAGYIWGVDQLQIEEFAL